MQNEIVKLLKKEGKLSEKTIDEISNIEIGDFSDLVRELGKEETEHIKRDEISKNLNTKYIGKDIYIFNEVMLTKCNENMIIIETRKRYYAWCEVQKQTIEMLSIMIKQVLLKYEA